MSRRVSSICFMNGVIKRQEKGRSICIFVARNGRKKKWKWSEQLRHSNSKLTLNAERSGWLLYPFER